MELQNEDIKRSTGLSSFNFSERNASEGLKPVVDIAFSLILLTLVFFWLFPLIGLLIILDSRGGVFFIQKRNGLYNRVFNCYKFRTMVVNDTADIDAAQVNDWRITRIGRFLRITGLDELPQLFNVLSGDMSIVGPRPHMISDNRRFEKLTENYSHRTLVKPGITGLAQVNGFKGNVADSKSIKMRTNLDLEYIKKQSLLLDAQIIMLTVRMTLLNRQTNKNPDTINE